MVIFIHALHPIGRERMWDHLHCQLLLDFQLKMLMRLASLDDRWDFGKIPHLKIYVSHGGGSFSTLLPRLTYGWETMEEIQKVIPHPPSYYAKKILL